MEQYDILCLNKRKCLGEEFLDLINNKNIIDKLKYIGLNLEKDIPESINNFKILDYRPSKYNDEHIYKVYKYINVKDIQILLTPTNRLNDITDKYRKSSSTLCIFRF